MSPEEEPSPFEADPPVPPPLDNPVAVELTFSVSSSIDPLRRRAVVELAGPMDVYTAPLMRRHLVEVFAVDGWDTILIDLRRVSFLDSAGMAAVIGAWRGAFERGKTMAAVVTSRTMRRLFQMTGVERLIVVVEDPAMFG